MAFDVSGLNNWFDENKPLTISKSILSGDTAAIVKQVTGVKKKLPLNGLYTTSNFVAESCARSASGTTTFTQRVLEVVAMMDIEKLCATDLLAKWPVATLPDGSPDKITPEIASFIMDQKMKAHASFFETKHWQGDTGSGDLYNGWLTMLNALGFGGANPIKGNPTDITVGTGIVASNIMGIMDTQWSLVPARVKSAHKGEIVAFVGYDTFTTYGLKVRDLNLFHVPAPEGLENGFVHPGTRMTIYPVGGLDGTNQIITTWRDNLLVGCDLSGEDQNVEWNEVLTDTFRGVVCESHLKAGVQVALPDEIVVFKLQA